jgi:hypothetical protein
VRAGEATIRQVVGGNQRQGAIGEEDEKPVWSRAVEENKEAAANVYGEQDALHGPPLKEGAMRPDKAAGRDGLGGHDGR